MTKGYPYISVPTLELLSRAVPSVRGYHNRSVGSTTGRNPGGRRKKTTLRNHVNNKTGKITTNIVSFLNKNLLQD